jgi:hypothetical protein
MLHMFQNSYTYFFNCLFTIFIYCKYFLSPSLCLMLKCINPLPALTPQRVRDLNVACSSKRPKAALLYSS